MSEVAASVRPARVGRWQRPLIPAARPLVRWLWPITVEGEHHLPVDGPAILCANHRAAIDPVMLPAALGRPIVFVGKAELLDTPVIGPVLPRLGMIPIDRSGGEAAGDAMATAAAVLAEGRWFGIFPEGTRTRTGHLHRGRTGAARLSLASGVPLHPVGLIGTDQVQRPGGRFPRPFREITVRIGAPLRPDDYRGRECGARPPRCMTDDLMFAIAALTGQRYVDTYARRRRPSAPPAAEPPIRPLVTSR